MKGLGFADGQTTWKVFDSEMTEYKTFEDVPDRFKTQLHRGMNAFLQLIVPLSTILIRSPLVVLKSF